MDLGDRLRSLGLEQYKVSFRDNALDETVLPKLMAEDLKDLGIAAVGHRRKLLDAGAALRNDGSVQTPSLMSASARPSALTPPPHPSLKPPPSAAT
jgi:hypothetical protein